MSSITIHCFVRGRVQGVGFRVHARQGARKLGLTGWVRNLDDGRVEMVISGESDQVDKFLDWLPKGVPSGRVDALLTENVSHQSFNDFSILPDSVLTLA